MSGMIDAIELARMGNSRAAADMLRGEFEKLQRPERIIDLCEWIADCFENLDDFVQAGNWYEAAGQLILSDSSSNYAIRAIQALKEYEKALGCYHRAQGEDDDGELVERCGAIVNQLRNSCACS